MSFKKCFFAMALLLFVCAFGFSQVASLGAIGTYNPFQPTFWSAGFMLNATSDYSGRSAHFGRVGMTFGQITLTYEKGNPFSSKHEVSEYWQKGSYIDWIFGYAWQVNLVRILALRLGTDFYFSYSGAYLHSDFNKDVAFNLGLTGLAGLTLFPKERLFLNVDACPGFTLNPLRKGLDVFAFILPVRLTAGVNFGLNVNPVFSRTEKASKPQSVTITIVNNTGYTIKGGGVFPDVVNPKDSELMVLNLGGDIRDGYSRSVTLPALDLSRIYTIMLLDTDDDVYVRYDITIASNMTVTFTIRDIMDD
jgi:hypothetical protein